MLNKASHAKKLQTYHRNYGQARNLKTSERKILHLMNERKKERKLMLGCTSCPVFIISIIPH